MEHAIDWHHLLPHWLPPVAFHALIVWTILLTVAVVVSRRIALVPRGAQSVLEWFIEHVRYYSHEIVGPESKNYDPLFIGIFFYIFASNLWGLVPGMLSPTANLNNNLAMALVVFGATHYYGARRQGVKKYLMHFCGEVPWWLKPFMFFIEIIGNSARPLSLTFRLFGNIVAKEVLLLILITLVVEFVGARGAISKAIAVFPAVLYPLLIVLGAFICYIQAFVFMLLSQVYIAGAVAVHDAEHH